MGRPPSLWQALAQLRVPLNRIEEATVDFETFKRRGSKSILPALCQMVVPLAVSAFWMMIPNHLQEIRQESCHWMWVFGEANWRAIFFFRFVFFLSRVFFGFLAFVGFCGFCGFSFRILCIHSSAVAFGGFPALAFRILCFPSWFLAVASCILSIASSSLVPPATPLSIEIHA